MEHCPTTVTEGGWTPCQQTASGQRADDSEATQPSDAAGSVGRRGRNQLSLPFTCSLVDYAKTLPALEPMATKGKWNKRWEQENFCSVFLHMQMYVTVSPACSKIMKQAWNRILGSDQQEHRQKKIYISSKDLNEECVGQQKSITWRPAFGHKKRISASPCHILKYLEHPWVRPLKGN